jgi:LPXTG-motif cell wall-anchored protein
MRRSFLSTMLIVAGLYALLASVGSWWGAVPARAQDPPPRPTLTPTPAAATPKPTPQPTDKSEDEAESAPPTGLITGTVIDQTSGAPVTGVAVVVGDVTVVTDANGNYGVGGLNAGNYNVALALAEGQGTPSQGPLVVALPADTTVVQHLAFRSPAPPAAPATPPTALPETGGRAASWGTWVLGAGLLALGLVLRRRNP